MNFEQFIAFLMGVGLGELINLLIIQPVILIIKNWLEN